MTIARMQAWLVYASALLGSNARLSIVGGPGRPVALELYRADVFGEPCVWIRAAQEDPPE